MMHFDIVYRVHSWVDIDSMEVVEFSTHHINIWIEYRQYHYEFEDGDMALEFIHILQKFNDDELLDRLNPSQLSRLLSSLHTWGINGVLTFTQAINVYEDVLLRG